MVKHLQKPPKPTHSSSSDEEPESQARRKKPYYPDKYDEKNKLKLNEFHRMTNQYKSKKRVPSTKKKIRDIERLLTHKDLSEEIKTKKLQELKELKKKEKEKREAEKFETRYKKIKFFEKRKVIRKLEKCRKNLLNKDIPE